MSSHHAAFIGAALATVMFSTATSAALVTNDYVFDFQFSGGPGGNYCGTGSIASCTYKDSPAIIKFNFSGTTATVDQTNAAFATIDGSEFSFSFDDGSNGQGIGTWVYTPDDAEDPGITGFSAKGSNSSNLFHKQSAAFAGIGGMGDFYTPVAGGSGKSAGLSNIVFFDTMTPVPVPAALPLFGSAVLGLAWWRRRRAAA